MVSQFDTAGAVHLVHRPARAFGGPLSVHSVDLDRMRGSGLSVFTFDEFTVRGHPFGPHPHAGFSAITYVLQDSPGGLHSRDSLGNDIVVGPGGIVWTQAGCGALHEELPATPGHSLHGLQVFVNLPKALKLTRPQVLHLDGPNVPEWVGPAGDRVRVVVGRFDDLVSPLRPAQPFRWLDVALGGELALELPVGDRMLAYVQSGRAQVVRDGVAHEVAHGQALALAGTAQPLRFRAVDPSRLMLLSGPAIDESMASNGAFVMADDAQLRDAVRRYRDGEMGSLEPVSL